MTQNLDNLTTQVHNTESVMASAAVLIGGFQARLDAAIAANQDGDDGAALDALSSELKTNSDALAAAVSANTPAAPDPEPAA